MGKDTAPGGALVGGMDEAIRRLESITLTTVGIDVGSCTSHLMFARVLLRRLGHALSSRFMVVRRDVLWRSPILLTPYRPDGSIDADRLGDFVDGCYRLAGLASSDIDTGAVILTGEALKRRNARAIADLFAGHAGKFVCATAGHHLEALMAAQGSGATAISRDRGKTVLHVDIGGGTTKLALIRHGEVLATSALAVGGRLVAWDSRGRIVRIEGPAYEAAREARLDLLPGHSLSSESERRLVQALAGALVSAIRRELAGGLVQRLLLTEPLPDGVEPELITFSGGVAEYIYNRERGDYGDLGRPLAREIKARLDDGQIPLPLVDPGQGIRATVIGASQFTVQVSGNTIAVSHRRVLPLRNLPVVYLPFDGTSEFSAGDVARNIRTATQRLDLDLEKDAFALAFRWCGPPSYTRLRALGEAIVEAMRGSLGHDRPLVLLIDGDVGRTLGKLIREDLGVSAPVVSIDGLQLREFDYVDIGEVVEPTNVVPVVIKSLLFPGDGRAVEDGPMGGSSHG